MTMHAQTVVSFEGVRFGYGKAPVLTDLTLGVEPGEVTLLAAPNGTGKSTALWLAAGLLAPDAGRVTVLGADPFRHREILGRVGFLAEGAPLPDAWTGHEVLAFQRRTFPRWDADECARLVRSFGLDLDQRVKALSRGQRGQLGLVAVLSTMPDVLLLDEPILGLDIATRRQFVSEVLGRVAEHQCPVLLTGHEIGELENAIERFALLADGRVVCNEPVAELLARHRILEWDDGVPTPPEPLDVMHLPSAVGHRALSHSWDEESAQMWLSAGGRVASADLETVYLSLTGGLEHA